MIYDAVISNATDFSGVDDVYTDTLYFHSVSEDEVKTLAAMAAANDYLIALIPVMVSEE